eukprot:TRINITY_DN6264_c0_g1_i11.p2 TRINITY_DN6264_c0_g1~~TRINITY_DN6264_c0_g1_i11.p2  ORF type:complete len:266 (-),score=36.30 TRINITY_DN6264_c0_g1_i11:406-1203(-)
MWKFVESHKTDQVLGSGPHDGNSVTSCPVMTTPFCADFEEWRLNSSGAWGWQPSNGTVEHVGTIRDDNCSARSGFFKAVPGYLGSVNIRILGTIISEGEGNVSAAAKACDAEVKCIGFLANCSQSDNCTDGQNAKYKLMEDWNGPVDKLADCEWARYVKTSVIYTESYLLKWVAYEDGAFNHSGELLYTGMRNVEFQIGDFRTDGCIEPKDVPDGPVKHKSVYCRDWHSLKTLVVRRTDTKEIVGAVNCCNAQARLLDVSGTGRL